MAIDWDEIRREYAPLVWSVVWRILAHDADALECSQDVFLEAMERSRDTSINNWGGYLRWLAARRAIDVLRRRRRQPESVDVQTLSDQSETASATVEFADLVEVVRLELTRLPTSQAEAFWLVCVEEHSYREVAELMNIKANAVGVLVHRARKQLRQALPHWETDRTDHMTRYPS